MARQRTTIYLDETDRQALNLLQARYGMASVSDVIRFAIRTLVGQPERQQTALKEQLPAFHSTGSEPRQHSPAVVEPVSQRVSSTLAAGSALVPQDEQVKILTEQLRGTQEELTRTQQEFHRTLRELQALNQTMLEMAVNRHDHVSAMPPCCLAANARKETKTVGVFNHQRIALLVQQSSLLRAENKQLVRQVRTEIAQLRAACLLGEPGGTN